MSSYDLKSDALAYIQQLEAELADAKSNHQHTIDIAEKQKEQIDKLKKVVVRLNKERDAAVADLSEVVTKLVRWGYDCNYCKHIKNRVCDNCHFEWRGVKEE